MKILYSIIFCFVAFFLQVPIGIGQATGDIEKDTALANQYFEKALMSYETNDTTVNAIDLLEKADALYEAHPFDEKRIEIKGFLAFQYAATNRTKALEIATSAIAIADKEQLSDKNPYAMRFIYAAMCQIYYNNIPAQCIDYGIKAMETLPKNTSLYVVIAMNTALSYTATAQFASIKPLLDEIEAIINDAENPHLKSHLPYFYYIKGSYALATRNLEQVIIYSKKALTENDKYHSLSPPFIVAIYEQLGVVYGAFGKFEEAIALANKGIASKIVKEDNPYFGGFYNMLGTIYTQKGDLTAAITYWEKAINYYLLDTINFAVNINITNFYLASVYSQLYTASQKDFQVKQSYLDKAEMYIRKNLKTKDQTLLTAYALLSKVLIQKKDYENAINICQKALISMFSNFKDTNIEQNPSEFEIFQGEAYYSLGLKARAWSEWGKEEQDVSKIKLGLATYRLALKNYELSMPKTKSFEQTGFANNEEYTRLINLMLEGCYDLYQLAPSDDIFNAILELIEKTKAIQLVETISPSSLPDSIYQQEQTFKQTIQDYGQRIDLATLNQQPDSVKYYQAALFQTNQEMEAYLEYLNSTYPKVASTFYNYNIAEIQEIKKVLSDNTLFVSYNSTEIIDGNTEGLILTLGQTSSKIIPFDIKSIKNDISKFNELIQDRFAFQKAVRDEFIDVSHELYKTLIQPIESELEGKSELMIVVEGALFNLPFELLLPTNEKKPYHELDFLIKKYEINYHYSATAMLRLQEKEAIQDNSMLAFAPIFSKGDELTTATRSLDFMVDSVYRSIENFEFVALPNTKKEVNAIAKMIKSKNGQTNILLHKNATKTNLSQQLEKQSYQFVHIATHGLVNFKNPRLSALACFSKNETMDNLIYANEIQFKDINADLVVLSSCESGIGQLVHGEGLIALNRSFIYSGAKNVLFSLWKVNDKYSSELMIDFYKYYLEGQSYTTALQNAKLEMLANPTSAQPNFWAAFILMGR